MRDSVSTITNSELGAQPNFESSLVSIHSSGKNCVLVAAALYLLL